MFSSRVPDSRECNRVTEAVRRARRAGRPLIDLTLTNPTSAGIRYPPGLLDALASPRALVYTPLPLGLPEAREAVARDFQRRGIAVASDRVVLTASTSDAYAMLFKLLCAPSGDAVMVPVPSYPLFDHLTRLDGVHAIPYPLEYQRRWGLDVDHLRRSWSGPIRAVLAVTPNNPTGSWLTAHELDTLSACCAERGAALVIDEVFADYPLEPGAAAPPLEPGAACLTFRLGGLSKSAGLPQVKLGWIAVDGPDATVRDALDRLELICDTYLSVSTPVQAAAPALIASGAAVREQILDRVRHNYRQLRALAGNRPAIEVLLADAGWSAVMRVPARSSEEDLVVQLIDLDGVVVHPGFFFDFPHEAFLVVSLLTDPPAFSEGIARLMERADG